jgi:hypothetical protein
MSQQDRLFKRLACKKRGDGQTEIHKTIQRVALVAMLRSCNHNEAKQWTKEANHKYVMEPLLRLRRSRHTR